MPQADWEDSISLIDIRDLLYIEVIERIWAAQHGPLPVCPLPVCRRHRFCHGPMVQIPGASLPRPWRQHAEEGFRPLCLQIAKPPTSLLTMEQILHHGHMAARMLALIPGIRMEDLLGNRIIRNRARRAARAGPEAAAAAAAEAAAVAKLPLRPAQTVPATPQSCRGKRQSRRRR